MNATAAIAQKLNVVEAAILEIQEWASVLWVRVAGLGARFVSKKVVKMDAIWLEGLNSSGQKTWTTENGFRRITKPAHGGYICFLTNKTVEKFDGVNAVFVGDPLNGFETLEEAKTALLKCSVPAVYRREVPNGMMMTSTGEIVSADDWDEIEGEM